MGLSARAKVVWEVAAGCWECVVVVGYSSLGTGRLRLVLGMVGWWSAWVEVVVGGGYGEIPLRDGSDTMLI